MMKPGRRWVSTLQVARLALMTLVATTLAFSAACRADDAAAAGDRAAAAGPAAPATDTTATPTPTPNAATPRVSPHRPARHLTVAQRIDENVRRLAHSLDLDPVQREKVRQILVDQHAQIGKLRDGNSAVPVDVTATTLAIYDQTKARIRAVLNPEQKMKYSADVPRDELAPGQADLKHWMDLQESKRRQGQSEDGSK